MKTYIEAARKQLAELDALDPQGWVVAENGTLSPIRKAAHGFAFWGAEVAVFADRYAAGNVARRINEELRAVGSHSSVVAQPVAKWVAEFRAMHEALIAEIQTALDKTSL